MGTNLMKITDHRFVLGIIIIAVVTLALNVFVLVLVTGH